MWEKFQHQFNKKNRLNKELIILKHKFKSVKIGDTVLKNIELKSIHMSPTICTQRLKNM